MSQIILNPPFRKFSGLLRVALLAIPFTLPIDLPKANWHGFVPDSFVVPVVSSPVGQNNKNQSYQLATTIVLSTPGSSTWPVPAGVTSITVTCIGNGGGGRNGDTQGRRGGGGGAISTITLSVTPAQVFHYTIIAGEAAYTGGYAGTPSPTQWDTTGNAFPVGNAGFGPSGGIQDESVGVTSVAGVVGGTVATGSGFGSGGGAAQDIGGTATAGGNATVSSAGAGGTNTSSYGAGGSGATPLAVATASQSPGGGGGGGGFTGVTGNAASAGGNGQITITYTSASVASQRRSLGNRVGTRNAI